jgi:hypothetical protein
MDKLIPDPAVIDWLKKKPEELEDQPYLTVESELEIAYRRWLEESKMEIGIDTVT